MKPITINITEFKAHALRLLAELSQKGREYVILKKGHPIARIVPIQKSLGKRRGTLKGMVHIEGDIVSFQTADEWDALK